MSETLDYRAETVKMVCEALENGEREQAKELLRNNYPFVPAKDADKLPSLSRFAKMRVFLRDGFIDRYSGDRLFFPPVLEALSYMLPEDFPYHVSGKMAFSHVAHWEMYPSVDHVVPVARGGTNEMGNWATTSFMHNLIKNQWTLEDLGWDLLPEGDIGNWDGMLGWFMRSFATPSATNVPEDLMVPGRSAHGLYRAALSAIAESERYTEIFAQWLPKAAWENHE
jgi:hypothetical protein